jgi:hypothetical protein
LRQFREQFLEIGTVARRFEVVVFFEVVPPWRAPSRWKSAEVSRIVAEPPVIARKLPHARTLFGLPAQQPPRSHLALLFPGTKYALKKIHERRALSTSASV